VIGARTASSLGSHGLDLVAALAMGFLLSALLATTFYFFQKARIRARESEAYHLDLLREIELRRESEERLRERTFQLEAANRELEAFNYSISHDLRTPLRSIDGFSKALLTRSSERLDGKGIDFLNRIRAACQRMSLLIDALLDLSRINQSEVKRVRVDVTRIACSLLEDFRRQAPGRKVETKVQEGLTVFGDAQLVETVLQNLIENAWKFTSSKEDGASIEVGMANRHGDDLLFVRDNGAGFDMAYSYKLFGIFQRLHSPSEFSGTGVGLATAQRVIHRHGGTIFAEGVVDRGAVFYFSFDSKGKEFHGTESHPAR
jgi:light-regulated signal transduction histidine kinase (bacteriophytochrome)